MNYLKFLFGLGVMLMLLHLSSCKEDCPPCNDPTNPDCENYDPCYGKRTINTYFKVRPGDRGFPPPKEWCNLTPCDTFNASSVRFDAPDGNPTNSTYEWQIGTEAEPRKGKSIEVDFSDYLNNGKWESYVTVTLTIRTPLNSCLENQKDTLVVISRALFFTEESLNLYLNQDTSAKFKGYFTHDKDKEVILEFTYFKNGSYKGFKGPFALMIGAPFMDTLMFNINCERETCRNYKHIKVNVLNLEACDNNTLSNYLIGQELIFSQNGKILRKRFEFSPPSGPKTYEFIGERL